MPRNGTSVIFNPRLEKPLLALQAATTAEAAFKAIFRLLKNTAACDFVTVFLRNVREDHRHVAYQMIDSRGRDFGQEIRDRVFFEEHPGMQTLMANPGIRFINTREILPPLKVLRKTRFYREVMQVIGFRHAIGMFFWSDPPSVPEAIFSICRSENRSDFDRSEVALFDRLYPHVDAALQRVRSIEQERTLHHEIRSLADQARRAVCVLDANLKVADANSAARESCAQWNLGAASKGLKPPRFQLPQAIQEACLRLQSDWLVSLRQEPILGQPKMSIVQHPENPKLRANISAHLPRPHSMRKPSFLIEFIEDPAPAPPLSLDHRKLLSTLNPRERVLVELICQGISNQEIANLTQRALGTVKNTLHELYQKLHVSSRGMLIALVGGTRR